jgi:hypothetical protein
VVGKLDINMKMTPISPSLKMVQRPKYKTLNYESTKIKEEKHFKSLVQAMIFCRGSQKHKKQKQKSSNGITSN